LHSQLLSSLLAIPKDFLLYLEQLFRKEKDTLLSSRLRAVYLALMGKSAPDIATLLGYRRRTIQNWVYAYNKHGLEGLRDTPGRGQRCKLNADQIQWLRQRLRKARRTTPV